MTYSQSNNSDDKLDGTPNDLIEESEHNDYTISTWPLIILGLVFLGVSYLFFDRYKDIQSGVSPLLYYIVFFGLVIKPTANWSLYGGFIFLLIFVVIVAIILNRVFIRRIF
jgi:hypothetical protein